MRLWRELPEERRAIPVSRDKVAALWTEAEVLRLTNLRADAEPQGRHRRARRAR